MKVLLDSGVWWRRTFQLPMKQPLKEFLAQDVTEWWLSPFSVAEMFYKVRHKGLPAPQTDEWFEKSLVGYRLANLSFAAGKQAGQWNWPHGDPIDRLLAATALDLGITLIHTDSVLKNLKGFPQIYFPA